MTVNARECPLCGGNNVCSVREAEIAFNTSSWGEGDGAMLDDAERVCSVCHAVRIDGDWTRMETVDSRAYELSQVSSSKSVSDYKEILTAGPERPVELTGDSSEVAEVGERAEIDGVEW